MEPQKLIVILGIASLIFVFAKVMYAREDRFARITSAIMLAVMVLLLEMLTNFQYFIAPVFYAIGLGYVLLVDKLEPRQFIKVNKDDVSNETEYFEKLAQLLNKEIETGVIEGYDNLSDDLKKKVDDKYNELIKPHKFDILLKVGNWILY